MRAIQAQECADLPRFSLVAGGSPVLLVVVQGDGGFDDFGDRAFVLGSFDAEGVEGVLREPDSKCWVFTGHVVLLDLAHQAGGSHPAATPHGVSPFQIAVTVSSLQKRIAISVALIDAL